MLAPRPVTLCSAEKVEWHHHQRLLQMHIKKQKATITSWFEKNEKMDNQRNMLTPLEHIPCCYEEKMLGSRVVKTKCSDFLSIPRSSASPSPIWQSSSYESSPGFPQKQTETINFLYENSFRSLYFPTLLVLMAISGHILNTIHSWFCFIRVRKLESCFL